MSRHFKLFVLVGLIFWQSAASAQTFELKNGKKISGSVKRESADFYLLKGDNGEDIVLLKSKIAGTASADIPAETVQDAPKQEISEAAGGQTSDVSNRQVSEISSTPPPAPEAAVSVQAAPVVTAKEPVLSNPPPAPEEPVQPPAPRADAQVYPWVDGAKGYNNAIQDQLLTGDPFVLYFYTNWCHYCKQFKKGTLNTVRVNDALKGVVKVSLNGDTERALMAKYQIPGYPTFLVIPKSGAPIPVSTGLDKEGFLKACAAAGLKVRL